MVETSMSKRLPRTATSIVPEEVEQFAAQAGDWWDPAGSEAMLHKLNPVRLKYIRDMIDQHWQCDECSRTPLEGKTALDVGCGAGLLAEPLARLGAAVTGIDASPATMPPVRGWRSIIASATCTTWRARSTSSRRWR